MISNEVEHYSDVLDIGSDIAQRERDNQVALIQAKVKPIPTSKVCLYCGNPTENGARWCNSDCRDDDNEEPARVGW